MLEGIIKFFDKLEDNIRGTLSRYPISYALIGGAAIVLFWRGVWHAADAIDLGAFESILIGAIVLLLTGLFTASFIGDRIIISGLKHEKKITETTEEEVISEELMLKNMQKDITEIKKRIEKKK